MNDKGRYHSLIAPPCHRERGCSDVSHFPEADFWPGTNLGTASHAIGASAHGHSNRYDSLETMDNASLGSRGGDADQKRLCLAPRF
jgi:hypothetical protein